MASAKFGRTDGRTHAQTDARTDRRWVFYSPPSGFFEPAGDNKHLPREQPHALFCGFPGSASWKLCLSYGLGFQKLSLKDSYFYIHLCICWFSAKFSALRVLIRDDKVGSFCLKN